MRLSLSIGVVDLRGLPPHLVHTADPLVGGYASVLKQAGDAGWGFLSGAGGLPGVAILARLEAADGRS